MIKILGNLSLVRQKNIISMNAEPACDDCCYINCKHGSFDVPLCIMGITIASFHTTDIIHLGTILKVQSLIKREMTGWNHKLTQQ